MFYSHQLLARKAPLGQIWMAATMHAKMNRKKLNKLNIIHICEEILNPSVPMALRLSGILMGGVVIVYERKVKLLYDDVTRLLVEINEAWKVKTTTEDPTLLPRGKSYAKREAVTLPEKEGDVWDIEQSLNSSTTTATIGFQRSAYFNMQLDTIDEPYLNNTEEEDACHHQAVADNITLFERFESFQTNGNLFNQFERFDIEGDEEIQPNFTSKENTEMASTFIPSPPAPDEPSRDDKNHYEHPAVPITKQSDEHMDSIQDKMRNNMRNNGTKRKRKQQAVPALDYEQIIIPGHTYQSWLQHSTSIVSRRGNRRKRVDVISTTKVANLMELPPVVLMGNLFTNGNRELYYPRPLLELWMKSTQPPQDSPSERISTMLPPDPTSSSQLVNDDDLIGVPFEDGRSGVGTESYVPSLEKQRAALNDNSSKHIVDDLVAGVMNNGLRAPELNQVTPRNSGGNINFPPSSVSEHGSAAHNREVDSGRSNKERPSFSRNSSGGLQPVAEENSWQKQSAPNFRLARLSETGQTPDHELLVETGPTQTQHLINNHHVDQLTDSIKVQMKAYFDIPGAPQSESLDHLAAGLTRTKAALLFYQTCVLASEGALRVEQKLPYGEIFISKGAKMC